MLLNGALKLMNEYDEYVIHSQIETVMIFETGMIMYRAKNVPRGKFAPMNVSKSIQRDNFVFTLGNVK